MSYYDSQGNDEEGVDEYDDYDPTPYDGGFNIALIYGRPLPASEEICYPISSSSSSDYERPQYEADSEPSAYGDEALVAEYSSYSRPKPYGGSEYGRPSYEEPEAEAEAEAEEEYRNTSYEQPKEEEEEEGYRKPARYEQPEDEEEVDGYSKPSYGRTSYGNQEEEEYEKPSYEDEYGERTYGRQKSDDEDNEDEEKRERRNRW